MSEDNSGIFFDFPTWEAHGKPIESCDNPLERMIEMQRSLMRLVDAELIPVDVLFMLTISSLIGEATETGEFFGNLTKPWKKTGTLDLDHIKEETIDILHFLLQLFIILKMDANEIEALYERKNGINFKRVSEKVKGI